MRLVLAAAVLIGGLSVAQASPPYRILVSSESGDIVTQLAWNGTSLATVKVVPVGVMPAS